MVCGDRMEIGGRIGGRGEIFVAIVIDPELRRIVGPFVGFNLSGVNLAAIIPFSVALPGPYRNPLP